MNEKLEYIKNEIKKIDEEINEKLSENENRLEAYEDLLTQAMADEDYAKALGLRLRILEIENSEAEIEDNVSNVEDLCKYPEILDLYIKLDLYQEAYDFCYEVLDKEYDLSDSYAYNEFIHVYKYIPCLCYALQMEDEYEVVSKELYNLVKEFLNEELDGDIGYLGEVYFAGAKVYVLLKEYEKAIEFFRKASAYYDRSEAEYKADGKLNKTLKDILKNQRLDYCDAMIEVYTLTGIREKVEKYTIRKIELLETK